MEWLNQWKFIISHFWKLDAKNQGVGRAVLFWKMLGKDLFQVSLLSSGSSLVCDSIFTWHSPCVLAFV